MGKTILSECGHTCTCTSLFHSARPLVSLLASPNGMKPAIAFTRMKPCRVVIVLVFGLLSCTTWSYSIISRRDMIRRAVMLSSFSATAILSSPSPILAATNARDSIQQAQTTLTTLLDNWQRATVDCTFADVPRDLLERKNKELLLEKAKTSALFDKSASVETCKTTNRIVRDYLGVTGKGPLVGMEKQLKMAMDDVDADRLEDYIAGMSVNYSSILCEEKMKCRTFSSLSSFLIVVD